jgi:DNA processing protein
MYYWLALNFVHGIGSVKYKALISHFKSPENVFKADSKELCRVDGIGNKLAQSIKTFNDFKAVETEIEKAKSKNVKIINYLNYPLSLKKINDSPPLLYVMGDLSEADDNAFGIVGARKASIENLTFAEDVSYKLAKRGVTIISGMALGIDSAAHMGSMKAGGRTIAVLGSGVDVIYPYSNKDMYKRISGSGAVISEFRLGTPPSRENFPKRNRIISGLSKGVLVVEANTDSGSLITADYALKQNKKLFAVPGDIRKDKAKGTNSLIKRGALLVDSVDDIFDNITFDRRFIKKVTSHINKNLDTLKNELSDSELKIYKIIKDEAMHIDDIIKKSSFKTSLVSGALLNLELKGYIKQFSGKMFVKVDNFST